MTVVLFVLAGLACIVAAAALFHPLLGLAALGVALMFVGWASMPAKE